ncbi:PREDICTED: alpha-1A adrenergic receptor-like [Acropora digitifera]|uniref:alpha-1A adrenergic receptor-like n=1 Tax=Acropora digitifera TaxID=70779 RepID=UPI00077A6EB7|nr:PREDICTED: alpha-1A adrenergic receptor-like [Acropora digitifera]
MMTEITPNTTTNRSSSLPYLACPIPGVSMEIQQQLQLIHNYILCPLSLTIAACSFLANFFLIVSVMRLKGAAHPSLTYFSSLAVSDLIWTTVQFYRCVFDYLGIYHCSPRRLRIVSVPLGALSFCGTLCNLIILSMDRYRAISKPLWYRTHMTQSRATRDAIITWLLSLMAACVISPTLMPSFSQIQPYLYQASWIAFIIFVSVCNLVIIVCHVKIFKATIGHRNNIISQCDAQQTAALLQREKKITKTLSLIMITFVISYLPPFVITNILRLIGYFPLSVFLGQLYVVLISLNGLLNPMICFVKNENLRRSLRDLFKCRCTARD